MTSVDGIGGSESDLYAQLSQRRQSEATDTDRNQFLELMVAQLKHQNPLEPQEGGEFLAQLAQFSTVEGIDKLNQSVSQYGASLGSARALQASAMVGRQVRVPADGFEVRDQSPIRGAVQLPAATDEVHIRIERPSGELVNDVALGPQDAGSVEFYLPAVDSSGAPLPLGDYRLVPVVAGADQVDAAPAITVDANVDSVSIEGTGAVLLNVAGVGKVSLDEVTRIE
ncbi:MAG: flagellar hook assembly protein FlgD [Pseudomonadota bacterium]|nr:flagellar hook assembly protein FlgD [Pseudomonadota bacterium]